jgi:hypothetical protein
MNWQETIQRNKASILRLQCGESAGTGIVVAQEAQQEFFCFATAAHVLQSFVRNNGVITLSCESPKKTILVYPSECVCSYLPKQDLVIVHVAKSLAYPPQAPRPIAFFVSPISFDQLQAEDQAEALQDSSGKSPTDNGFFSLRWGWNLAQRLVGWGMEMQLRGSMRSIQFASVAVTLVPSAKFQTRWFIGQVPQPPERSTATTC